jgi:hypothetical protein
MGQPIAKLRPVTEPELITVGTDYPDQPGFITNRKRDLFALFSGVLYSLPNPKISISLQIWRRYV